MIATRWGGPWPTSFAFASMLEILASIIDGVYAGIKSGDGLRGGGSTFNWSDASGAMQAEATVASGGSATWPSAVQFH
jgi:hypothetical protein